MLGFRVRAGGWSQAQVVLSFRWVQRLRQRV